MWPAPFHSDYMLGSPLTTTVSPIPCRGQADAFKWFFLQTHLPLNPVIKLYDLQCDFAPTSRMCLPFCVRLHCAVRCICELIEEHTGIMQTVERLQKKCIIRFMQSDMHIICNAESEDGIQVWSEVFASLFWLCRLKLLVPVEWSKLCVVISIYGLSLWILIRARTRCLPSIAYSQTLITKSTLSYHPKLCSKSLNQLRALLTW